MSVMACDRNGCNNIMSSRLFDGKAYICDDCYQELLIDKASWSNNMNGTEVKGRIETFMSKPASGYVSDNEEIEEEFNSLIREV